MQPGYAVALIFLLSVCLNLTSIILMLLFYGVRSINMDSRVKKLIGSNMDIDFISDVKFGDSLCPWNVNDGTYEHKCAVKNTSICKYFCGIQWLDSVLCSYPHEAFDFRPRVPNAETLAAIEEVRRMKADPSLGKSYTNIDEMMKELLE